MFVYKSLKGQNLKEKKKDNKQKKPLYHLKLPINLSKTAKLQLAWYIL